MTDTIETLDIQKWPRETLCIGCSPVTDKEAIAWAQKKGASVVYYVPETQTAFIPAIHTEKTNG